MPRTEATSLLNRTADEPKRPLTADDAVDIWIARWLRVPRRVLCARFGCDARRLYEIWQEERFAGSRDRALAELARRYPGLTGRIDPGVHRKISRTTPPEQLGLFDR